MTEARLKVPPSESLLKYVMTPGLKAEMESFSEFIDVDLAHTVMLVEQEIITREEGQKILKVLTEIKKLGKNKFPTDPRKGSFLLQVEDYLFGKIGEGIGGKMHTGRSRIDQGATVKRLYARNKFINVIEALIKLQKTILKTAIKYRNTVMPGYTHMQHAQPWLFGHYLLGYFEEFFSKDFQRLINSYSRTNLNPLGTVALVGTSWPLNRIRTTELLGFEGIIDNAKFGREQYYAAELVAMLSILMSHMNDLATDLHIWSTYEFRLLETADEFCGSSSIMPQKKNPSALENIKSTTSSSISWLSTALGCIKQEGTGDTSTRQVPITNNSLYLTKNMLEFMSDIIETLIVHEDRMLELASKNWNTASNLADFIVKTKGLSYRTAHHVVGRLVRIALDEGKAPLETTGSMVDRAAKETIGITLEMSTDEIRNVLDPVIFINTRITRGSTSKEEMERMINKSKNTLEEESNWLAGKRKELTQASEKLVESVNYYIVK